MPNITANYHKEGEMVAERFVARGFREFAFFGNNGMCWSDGRQEGFRDYLTEAGFEDNIHIYDQQRVSNLWYYRQSLLHDWLLSLPKPVGIFACDDNQASILVEACDVLGIRIPYDAAIIGVDNDELLCSLGNPTLSSIMVNIEEGGYRTAELIEQMVTNPDTPVQDIVLRPIKIVGRISTAAYATDDIQIQKAVQFIHQNYQKKIGVKDVMSEVALSRRLLERRFKQVTGITLYQYMSDLKIKRFAELLLENPDEQITGIALSLGESDTKSISRRFKQIYGCSPHDWRIKQQNPV